MSISPSNAISFSSKLPDPENFQTLSQDLQTAIKWIQRFAEILPDARKITNFLEEGRRLEEMGCQGSYALHQSHGRVVQENYSRCFGFTEVTRNADLPLLKKLFQSPSDLEEIKSYCEKHQSQIYCKHLFEGIKSFIEQECTDSAMECAAFICSKNLI